MPIVVYGATGRLGGLVLTELITGEHPVSEADLVVAGRDADKLRTLAGRYPQATVCRATVDDGVLSGARFDGCQVVINCASPPAPGAAVARAAVAAGAHYIDAAGEQAYIQTILDLLDIPARERGVAVIPACGFDYAIGDCLARLVAQGMPREGRVSVGYALAGRDIRRNSLSGAMHTEHRADVVYRDGQWRPAPVWRVSRRRFPFPGGTRTVTRYASGEVITVPRHTAVRTVESYITTDALSPHPALDPVFPYLRPVVATLLRTPLRGALGLAAGVLGGRGAGPAGSDGHEPTAPSGGPGAEQDDPDTPFEIGAVVTGGAATRVGYVTGTHNHRLTAFILATAAKRLRAPDFAAIGALTPAIAFDPERFLAALAPRGIEYRLPQ